jgi:hypothetical protein
MVVKRVGDRAGFHCKQCVTERKNKYAEGPVLQERLP